MVAVTQDAPRLLLSPRYAAKALSISEKTLWSNTAPRGDIPVVRVGARGVRYSLEALQQWVERRQAADIR